MGRTAQFPVRGGGAEAISPVTVLVADGAVLFRAGLAALIRAAPGLEAAGVVGDGRRAVAEAARLRPDVVLMDVAMAGLDGIAAAERILVTEEAPKVVILTAQDQDDHICGALRVGVSGFLLKDSPPEQLLNAIYTIAVGGMPFAPTVTRRLIEAYTERPTGPGSPPPVLGTLTRRETQVLYLVGRALPNAEVARRLQLGEATVKSHLNRAMTKLNLSSRAEVVALAYETGLITPGRGRLAVPAAAPTRALRP